MLYSKPFYLRIVFTWTQEDSCIREAIKTRILGVFIHIKYLEFYNHKTTTVRA